MRERSLPQLPSREERLAEAKAQMEAFWANGGVNGMFRKSVELLKSGDYYYLRECDRQEAIDAGKPLLGTCEFPK